MTRTEANLLLDAVRTGKQNPRLSHITIRHALRVTGDLSEPMRVPSSRRMPNYGTPQRRSH